MSLPRSTVPSGKVALRSGEVVEVKGLTRAQALHVRERYENEGLMAMERQTLAYAFGVELAELDAWYDQADNNDVDTLSAAIARLSGLDDEAGKDGAGS